MSRKRPNAPERSEDRLERRFEGRVVLDKLLAASGTKADAEDVLGAFKEALKVGAPPPVVIQALWDDEPHFESLGDAERLFSNLLGLAELLESGAKVDFEAGAKVKRKRSEHPGPTEGLPDESYVEAAWRYFEDHPKERERLQHAFDNRQDALISWLETQALSDDALGLVLALVSDVFAMLELSGRKVGTLRPPKLPQLAELPASFTAWVDEGVFEATQVEEEPLSEHDAAQVKALALQVAGALVASAS